MRIKKLKLFTHQLELEKKFYKEDLGFELLEESPTHFGLKIGWSELYFEKSSTKKRYHYCFLIPSNQFQHALNWMKKRTEIIEIEKGRYTQHFESWNADSFYFYDASGNLAEFIARHDLKNENYEDFDQGKVLGINEIGFPTSDIERSQKELNKLLGTSAWKGDTHRFGTHGDEEALILLPNYRAKDSWFPTQQKIQSAPFEVVISTEEALTHLRFDRESISTLSN